MRPLLFVLIVVVLAGAAFIALSQCEDDWCYFFDWQKIQAADSFERCASLGFPVMESFPRQCRAGDKTFVENVNSPKSDSKTGQPVETNMIRVSTPLPNSMIKSPVTIKGEARGNWYFEASFPVELLDANGKRLALAPVQAEGEWMTTNFVPFDMRLSFSAPSTETGKLILHKDNPSGLPEHDDKVEIPVRFDLSAVPMRAVKLYYYNSEKDKDASGNIMCSRQGLQAVDRQIPVTQTPIQDAIRQLLRGEVTQAEKGQGISTEFPLPGVQLKSANLANGILTLEFDDPNNRTGGGSCRVAVLWAQIEATAKQFSGVSQVRFKPEELFQP